MTKRARLGRKRAVIGEGNQLTALRFQSQRDGEDIRHWDSPGLPSGFQKWKVILT